MKRFLIQRSITAGINSDLDVPGSAGSFPIWMDCWGADKDAFGNRFIATKAQAKAELKELRRVFTKEVYRLVEVVE